MDLGNLAPPGQNNARGIVNAVDRAVKAIGVGAATAAVTYAVDAARDFVRGPGPNAEEPPAKRQRVVDAENPYKRTNTGNINDRATKRQRNVEQLLGTSRPSMVYHGKRGRSSFKRSYNRRRPATRRPAVRRRYRKTYSKKRVYAKKSTMTAARLMAGLLK